MSASISYKLKNSIQGALAGGGDPATSPLYVFGPFLSLIVAAGVAQVTFGASIWLAVFTVASVSAMYRYVMKWVTDGSGGSGLSEEELGSWAVKTNAAITVIEYTLTFLVSIAALVTFLSDRIPSLKTSIAGLDVRSLIAIGFSVLIAVVVNRGAKIAANFFGPATALILLFLWVMVGSVIWQRGLHFPDFNLMAFDRAHLEFTLGGFARILALMTGIEIFANLVASYEGSVAQRSRRAYGSLLIVMGTTVATMLVVGPAIFDLANPLDPSKSVFTQTMDALLPQWLSYAGTLIGIAVLLSAAAASTQGIQNLALGLRARHYIPARWGKKNKFDVPSFPAWAQVLVVVLAFLFFGSHEETYLALYAAGVFVLLSMTGWSAFKRFIRFYSEQKKPAYLLGMGVTSFSALCATLATFIIFKERFADGAWSYLVMVPALYLGFDFYRRRLGAPPEAIDARLSTALSAQPLTASGSSRVSYKIDRILVPLSGSINSDVSFYSALKVASNFGSTVVPLHIAKEGEAARLHGELFLKQVCDQWGSDSFSLEPMFIQGDAKKELVKVCENGKFDLICMSSTKFNNVSKLTGESFSFKILYATTPPIILMRPTDDWLSRSTEFKNILVPLDGSDTAEQVLPYVNALANQYESKITLFTVPEVDGDSALVARLTQYLENIRSRYFGGEADINCVVEGSGPSRTLLAQAQSGAYDLIALVSHGRGGVKRQGFVKLGSVAESILTESCVPMLFVSAR